MSLIMRFVLSISTAMLFSLACLPVAFAQEGVTEVVEEAVEKDAETVRFEAELRSLSEQSRYPTPENAIAGQVYIFSTSTPDLRQGMWQELEAGKQQLVEQQEKEAEDAESLQNMDTGEFDAETLRYKAMVEQLNLPPDMVEDLVETYQSNDAAFRKTLWDRAEAMLQAGGMPK